MKRLSLKALAPLLEQFRRGGGAAFGAKVAEVCLELLLAVLLARLLGASGYGIYAFVFALASLLSMPARMGLPPLVVRETARGGATGDWESVRGVWQWANAVTMALSLLVLGAGMLWLWVGWFEGQHLRRTLFFGLCIVPLLALAAVRSASLRGLRHVVAGVVPQQVLRPALMAVLLLLVTVWPGAMISPAGAMGLMMLSALATFLVAAGLLSQHRPKATRTVRPRRQGLTWFKAAWPMALTHGFGRLNRYADVILLGVIAGAIDVGVYRVGAQGAILVSLGLTALTMAAAPFFTHLHAEAERDELQKLARRTAQAALGFAILTLTLLAFWGEWLLVTLFGPDFSSAFWPLLILASGQLANAGIGPTGMLLNMTGYERDVTRVAAIAAGVNLALNLALIPLLGVIGAALATSVSMVLWNVWLWVLVQTRLGIRCSVI